MCRKRRSGSNKSARNLAAQRRAKRSAGVRSSLGTSARYRSNAAMSYCSAINADAGRINPADNDRSIILANIPKPLHEPSIRPFRPTPAWSPASCRTALRRSRRAAASWCSTTTHLAIWERGKGTTNAELKDGTKVTVYFRNPKLRESGMLPKGGIARFYGTAKIHKSGPMYDEVWQQADSAGKGSRPGQEGLGGDDQRRPRRGSRRGAAQFEVTAFPARGGACDRQGEQRGSHAATIPVLIVGGGPVGLALALDLGWRNVPCLLVEQGDGEVVDAKMFATGIRTVEFCRRWGIAEQGQALGFSGRLSVRQRVRHQPERSRTRPHSDAGAEGHSRRFRRVRNTSRTVRNSCSIRSSRAAARAYPSRHAALSLPAHGVSRHRRRRDGRTARRDDRQREEPCARDYLVGCDGIGSMVRKALGIEMRGIPIDQSLVQRDVSRAASCGTSTTRARPAATSSSVRKARGRA